jgi:hypothetical protein
MMCLKNGSVINTIEMSLLFLFPKKHTLTEYEIFLENIEAGLTSQLIGTFVSQKRKHITTS